jgi:cytoskeletal protein CcmA (bactofilin family)
MWKSGKPEERTAPAQPTVPSFEPKKEIRPMEPFKQPDNFRAADVANIGKSVIIKGELSGSEDLFLDGEVEGSIDLADHNLTIGPHGRIRANVHAKDVVIHGKVDGNVYGTDRVELKRSAVLTGDISTQRIVIEDGAYFKGAIDIKKESKPAASTVATSVVKETPKAFAAAASFEPSATPQVSFAEEKKY